jgi:hypothetical protein
MNTIAEPEYLPLGASLPPGDPHVRDMTAAGELPYTILTAQGRQRPPAKMG